MSTGRRANRDIADSQVEKRFWGSMHMEPPIYGADSEGSLFDEGPHHPLITA
jgi:hypothetical protein